MSQRHERRARPARALGAHSVLICLRCAAEQWEVHSSDSRDVGTGGGQGGGMGFAGLRQSDPRSQKEPHDCVSLCASGDREYCPV